MMEEEEFDDSCCDIVSIATMIKPAQHSFVELNADWIGAVQEGDDVLDFKAGSGNNNKFLATF